MRLIILEYPYFCQSYRNDRERNGTFTEKCEALRKIVQYYRNLAHDERKDCADNSLKIVCKNLFSVKCYDKTNMKVFALSLWKNQLGLNLFWLV